ncbi:MAG: DUF6263 family protein [bacterium]
MRKKGIISLLILLIIFMCGCFPKEKSILLQYKYQPGEILKYKFSNISKGIITTEGLPILGTSTSPIEVMIETRCKFTQKVTGIEEGGVANIDFSYDSFEQDIKTPIFSQKQANPFFNLLEGKSLNIKIGKDGSLLKQTGIEEIPGQIPENIQQELIPKFKAEWEKNIVTLIERSYQRFPLEEMKVGDSWIRELSYNIPLLGTTRGKFAYTIEEWTQIKGIECVQVGIEANLTVSEREPFVFPQEIDISKVTFNGAAQGKGKMIFAYQQGRLMSNDLEMDVKMQVNYSQPERELKMNLDFKTQTLLELE